MEIFLEDLAMAQRTSSNSYEMSSRDEPTKDRRQPQQRRPFYRELINEWYWELFTWLLGTIAFATIIVLLLRFDNTRVSKWNFSIQLTSIIAALAHIMQSALLVPVSLCLGQVKLNWLQKERLLADVDTFDTATRGPEGRLRLLLIRGLKL